MSDRAYEIATRLWERLSHEPDPRSERTVNPIAEALRAYAEEARKKERESCASVAYGAILEDKSCEEVAAAIRARGETR